MPQHPKYTNSPEKNLEDLYQLLSDLEKFGFIHEELHQPINELMSGLYSEASNKHTLDENGLPIDSDIDDYDEEDLEFSTLPNAFDLWGYLDKTQQEQFIQDFRNVIAMCIYENAYTLASKPETYDNLVEMRDIEYYRMHIYISEDTETKNKYKNEKRSVWFPSDVTPVRVGIYEISSDSYENPKHSGFAYWDGSKWYKSCALLRDCIDQEKTIDTEYRFNFCWRGFLNPIS